MSPDRTRTSPNAGDRRPSWASQAQVDLRRVPATWRACRVDGIVRIWRSLSSRVSRAVPCRWGMRAQGRAAQDLPHQQRSPKAAATSTAWVADNAHFVAMTGDEENARKEAQRRNTPLEVVPGGMARTGGRSRSMPAWPVPAQVWTRPTRARHRQAFHVAPPLVHRGGFFQDAQRPSRT